MRSKTLKRMTLVSRILFPVLFALCCIAIVAQPILLSQADVINGFLKVNAGGNVDLDASATYFGTSFKDKKIEDVHDASKRIIEETMKEGAVLLKNENDALPLAVGDKVNLYGAASHYTVHVGQGSGGCEDGALADRVTLAAGLRNAGLDVNGALDDYYRTNGLSSLGGGNFIGGSTQSSQYLVKDIAWGSVAAAKNEAARAGIFVLARNSGEAVDLYMDVTMEDGSRTIDTKYKNKPADSVGDALVLTDNEKSVLAGMNELKRAGTLSSVIVLINCASPLECAFVDEYAVDACMWVGTIGTTGANAIGKLLTGEYTPSGRTSDTFFAENKYNPVYYNFGTMEYGNSGILNDRYTSTQGKVGSKHYVVYQEGIYNGYKYTETRYEDKIAGVGNPGDYDYSKVVSYPFGYGLSYTSFTYSSMRVEFDDTTNKYTVSVDVTNDTNVAGQEVVQVYLQKPYTEYDKSNGIETASAELVGFTKIELAGGETKTATVEAEEKYFAVYDGRNAKTYVIGSDDANDEYLLTAAKDAHDAVNNFLQYKKSKGSISFDDGELFVNAGRSVGNKDLVYGKHIAFDKVKYSTNAFIEEENKVEPAYTGAKVNYGVDRITNRFDDVDFRTASIFSEADKAQRYTTRSDWAGTCGKRISLTATPALVTAQANPEIAKDNVEYPAFGETGLYMEDGRFDIMKLVYLKGKDFNDPMWDTLLNQITQDEMCEFLQYGYRMTRAIPSVAAPDTAQQNGGLAPNHARTYNQLPGQENGFSGFVNMYDPSNADSKPPVFCCNGIVASTFNVEFIERLGEQTGEEAAWAGFNGIYGLGVNIHRGAYCGRTFEYYSEDGFLTGVAAGYEAVGMHKLGVFVLMKHAVLNDQETNRAGVNVWANEQTVREIYCRAIEVAVEIDRRYTKSSVLGVMTGMNRIGAKWTGAHGFCNTVLRAEFGMRGFVVSDYNTSRIYMNPVYGVLGGNDLPDGNPVQNGGGKDYDGRSSNFKDYKSGYGELAWAMRDSTHKVLYTVVNSNAMNGITSDTEVRITTPAWQTALTVLTRVFITLFVWAAVAFVGLWAINLIMDIRDGKAAKSAAAAETENSDTE